MRPAGTLVTAAVADWRWSGQRTGSSLRYWSRSRAAAGPPAPPRKTPIVMLPAASAGRPNMSALWSPEAVTDPIYLASIFNGACLAARSAAATKERKWNNVRQLICWSASHGDGDVSDGHQLWYLQLCRSEPDSGAILGQRLRRWPRIAPELGSLLHTYTWLYWQIPGKDSTALQGQDVVIADLKSNRVPLFGFVRRSTASCSTQGHGRFLNYPPPLPQTSKKTDDSRDQILTRDQRHRAAIRTRTFAPFSEMLIKHALIYRAELLQLFLRHFRV